MIRILPRNLSRVQVVIMNVNLYTDPELKSLKRAVDRELRERGIWDEIIEEKKDDNRKTIEPVTG